MAPGNKILTAILAMFWLAAYLPVFASDPPIGPVPDEVADFSTAPVLFVSDNEDFQIVFPGGCGKLVARSNEPDLFGGETWDDIIQVTFVFCDRYQVEGEGCSINATFNMPGNDGAMAGPPQVVELVESSLREFGAKVVNQRSIKKEFVNGIVVEGVELFGKSELNQGEVWIRGLLSEGDIYVLTAWNNQGGVWNNPDYLEFFNSFQPWVE